MFPDDMGIDDGSPNPCGSFVIDFQPNEISCVGRATPLFEDVVLNITSVNGDFDVCQHAVEIVDDTPPHMLALFPTFELGSDGMVTVNPLDVMQPFDNCGVDITEIVGQSVFTCNDIGHTSVGVRATDFSGNSHTMNVSLSVL